MRIISATRKSQPDPEETPDSKLIRQIDNLQFLSKSFRDDSLTTGHFDDAKRFFTLINPIGPTPSFRPHVDIPELQMLFLNEATDLSDADPRVYISSQGERDKKREKAFQRYWAKEHVNQRIFEANIWSLFSSVGFLQVGVTESGLTRTGRTRVWVKSRNPETVYPDPAATSEENWAYVILEDEMYIDQACQFFDRARFIRSSGRMLRLLQSSAASGSFELPPGPMSVTGGPYASNDEEVTTDGRIVVRYCFCYDSTEQSVRESAGSSFNTSSVIPAGFQRRYPHGRMIVDSEGIVLFDDDNPFPFSEFPIIRITSMPTLYGFWGVPPQRYSRDLQNLAGRMYTQVFENAVRLNNGVWFINEVAGVDPANFGGIPAEVQIVNSQTQQGHIDLKVPPAFPQHFLEYPELLLQKQRTLQGFTPARSGEPGSGNISPNLFDSSIYQSQFLTRMRSRLMAEPLQRLAEIMFYTMLTYMTDSRTFPAFNEADIDEVRWEGDPNANIADHLIELDPNSIEAVSAKALRQMVPMLRQQGLIDARTGLELMGIPGADEIADNIENEQKLAALAKMSRKGK